MSHAFRLGPVAGDEFEYLYVAMLATGEPVAVEANDDVAGLRKLSAAVPGQRLVVEPSMAKAGKRLGLRRARLPVSIAHAKATMALAIATQGLIDSDVDPMVLGDLLDAATAFMMAKPWRQIDGDTPLGVDIIESGEQRTVDGSLMGQAGQELGFSLYMQPGALQRILTAPDDEATSLAERMDMLAVSMEREPAWAARAIKQVLGISVVPMPMRMKDRKPGLATAREVATMAAVLRAASEIDRRTTEVSSKSGAEPRVEVTIRLPSSPSAEVAVAREQVGRNAPCPCGSGRKYKRCCLPRDEAAARASAARSEPYSLEVRLAEEIMVFANEHYPGWGTTLPLPWHQLSGRPGGLQLFAPLLAFQGHVRPDLTARQAYLEHHAGRLDSPRLEMLSAQAEAVLSVWEVLDGTPGVGMTLVDLLTGAQAFVHEVSGSRSVSCRHALLARVMTQGSRSEISGLHPRPLPPAAGSEVVTEIRKRLKLEVKPVPPERLVAPAIVTALLEEWHAAVDRLEQIPLVEREVQNTDGEPFQSHEDLFRLRTKKWREVVEVILSLPGVVLEGRDRRRAEVTFTRRGNAMHSHWPRTVIGTAIIDSRQLRLEANSRSRIDLLRGVLEQALGDKVVHAERTCSPVHKIRVSEAKGSISVDAMGSGGLWSQPPESLLREQARHYCETAHPGLDDRTPREAMQTARGRRALHQLLKENEHRHRPDELEGFSAHVRDLLGLSRTGEIIARSEEERRLGSGRKISETLLDFAAPLLQQVDDPSKVRTVIEMAAAVWNADVIAREGISSPFLDVARGLIANAENVTQSRSLAELMERRRLFAEDRRIIEVLDVRCRAGDIYVKAAACIGDPPRPRQRVSRPLDPLE